VDCPETIKIQLTDLSVFYQDRKILDRLTIGFVDRNVTAIVGPSGQGKSTLLTVVNKLWLEIPGARVTGRVAIRFDGQMTDIHDNGFYLPRLRQKVGMVFQEPNPLPMSIHKNVAFPLKLTGVRDRGVIEERVRGALKKCFLWEEVKDRLDADARSLSGGQQQRLCMARALILDPEVLLLDEPTASLDEKAVGVIESLIDRLKGRCTVLLVSHYMDQVHRVADRVVELSQGKLFPRDHPGPEK
jgi:phosphate transport system ATP-binding protein